jgi:hypothetical protein
LDANNGYAVWSTVATLNEDGMISFTIDEDIEGETEYIAYAIEWD